MKSTSFSRAGWLLLGSFGVVQAAFAQTDYYNLDEGRPVVIEDAYPTERYAFEGQIAPFRLERGGEGAYAFEVEPELAYGILPRTQIEVGVPISYVDQPGGVGEGLGIGGIEASLLHNLNVETRTLPGFGVAASVAVPVGRYAAQDFYGSVKGIATRTFSFARFHLNGQYTFGPDPDEPEEIAAIEEAEQSRWMAGIAVDKVFPLRALLAIGNLYARQPLVPESSLEWNAGAGIRYQVNPRIAIDTGVGRTLTGGDQEWFFTFGAAYLFGIRSLIPVPGR